MKEIKGESVAILGYGREGRSAHRYLSKHYPEKRIGIVDQNEVEPLIGNPRLHTREDYLESLKEYDTVIRSPGIDLEKPEIQAAESEGTWLTSTTNIFFSESLGETVGVTGSLGKSTTISLIFDILSASYEDVRLVGNIGNPFLDNLDQESSQTLYCSELSSYQLEDCRYSPKVSVLLNIIPEHLDRHGSFDSYVEAKSQIARYQSADSWFVYNPDHQVLSKVADLSRAKKVKFGLSESLENMAFYKKGTLFVNIDGKTEALMDEDEIPLLGPGNIENTLAAVTVGLLFEIPLDKIRQAIEDFESLSHRIEFVGEYRGIKFYDDSISTVPESSINALKALGEDVSTLILGGYDRGIDFDKIGEFLAENLVKNVILFPQTGSKIWQSIANSSSVENLPQKFEVEEMEKAIELAYKYTPKGKICLLSPASPSFGLFKDYRDRGEQFKKCVLELGKENE